MNENLRKLTHLISNCDMDNTYKMGWARAITEFLVNNPESRVIHFDDLAPLIFKYYWNQTIFFDLQQGPNPNKPPVIHQIVKTEISKLSDSKPVPFTRVESEIEIPVTKISDALAKDVSHRFLKLGPDSYQIYDLDNKNRALEVHWPEVFREYADLLFELINYRWVQQLEKFNSSPRISKKVKGTDREQIRRGSLSKFKKYLYLENPDCKCFISGEPISGDESIDHVIPWSYLYSDDLWNLVLVKKGLNSSKSNKIPSEELIERLEDRNQRLVKLLENQKKDKHVRELELAIEKHFVRKFWVGCKG